MATHPAVLLVLASVLLASGRAPAAGPVGSEFQVNEQPLGAGSPPRLAMNPGGEFVVVWDDPFGAYGSDVRGRRFDAAAQPLGAAFLVNTYTAGVQAGPAVAAAASGEFVVVWTSYDSSNLDLSQDGSAHGVFGQRFTSAGVPLGPEFQVNTYTTGSQRDAAIASAAAGHGLVVWGSSQLSGGDSHIVGQPYDASGTPQGPELQINTTLNFEAAPRVAADGAGNFVVVWVDFVGRSGGISHKILARRYDGGGVPLGAEFQVNVSVGSSHRDPDVAAAAGGFVVVWNEAGILARRYDAAGTPLGLPFVVDASGSQPAVAMDAAGGFVVVWKGTDADGAGVVARRYDAAGVALGAAFQVNTYTPGLQDSPAVGVDATGRFLVVWSSEGQDAGGRGLFGQRFDAAGNPVPGEIPVAGGNLVILDPSPTRRTIKFRTTDTRVGNGINPLISPVIQGAWLHVFNAAGSGDSACFFLPPSGWTSRGRPGAPLFFYRDADFVHGPCNRVRLRRGRFLRAGCRSAVQPITYTLDEPFQGNVGVSLTVGPATYCALFGGTVRVDSGARHRFAAGAAGAQVLCPIPPVACP